MNTFFQPLGELLNSISRQPKSHLIPLLPLLGAILLFFSLSNEKNKYLDVNYTYAILWLALIVFVSGLILSLPWIIGSLKTLGRSFPIWIFIIPLLLAGMATYFVSQHVEPRHRIQSDEAGLLSNARSMENLGKAASCDQGYFSRDGLDCIDLVQNFKTKSVPFFFSLIQNPAFPQGLSSRVVFNTTLSLLLPTAIFFFLALLTYSQSPWIATITTALFLSHPTLLFQFNSASVEPWYLFFAAFAGFVFVSMQQDLASASGPRYKFFPLAPLAVVAALVAFAAQTRQESLASFGFILAPLWLQKSLNQRDKVFFFTTLSVLVLPVLWLAFSYRGYDFQAGDNQAHGINNLIQHARIAWEVMTRAPESDGLTVPFIRGHMWLAAAGFFYTCVQIFRKDALSIKILWFFLLALPQTLVIFENISGDMTIEINQRYSLVFIPLISLMGAQGFRMLFELASVAISRRSRPWVEASLLALVCAAIWSHTAQYKKSFENNIMYSRNQLASEEQQLRSWYQSWNPDTAKLFIHSRPWQFVAYGQSAIHYSTWLQMDSTLRQLNVERFQDQIYYVRGLDCWDQKTWHHKVVEERISHICDQFERSNSLQLVHRDRVTGDYDLEVSRLEFPSDSGMARIRIENLVVDIQPQYIRIRGESTGCAAISPPLVWMFAGNRQSWNCTDGELDITFPSGPGLRQLKLLEPPDKVIWSRVVLHTDDSVVLLANLEPVFSEVGWRKLEINKSNGGNALTVNGERYEFGLGTHAPSKVSYKIPRGFTKLQFGYGLDDEETGGDGVVFRVFGDEKLLWESQNITHKQVFIADVDIVDIEKIDLVTDAGLNNHFDHSNWISPVLLRER